MEILIGEVKKWLEGDGKDTPLHVRMAIFALFKYAQDMELANDSVLRLISKTADIVGNANTLINQSRDEHETFYNHVREMTTLLDKTTATMRKTAN